MVERLKIHTPSYAHGRTVPCENGSLVSYEDYKELAKQLRQCRIALDSLIEQKPGIQALVCGQTTIGNLRAELGRPETIHNGK